MRITILFVFASLFFSCQRNSEDPLEKILLSSNGIIKEVFDNQEKFELQILYTRIDRDKYGLPRFTSFSYEMDTIKYFYPASTVKMPVAFLAIQRINELAKTEHKDISMYSSILFDSISPPQSRMFADPTSPTGKPTIAHFIEKIFAVSDNNSYNRLYEFLGQDYINDELSKKGIFSNSRIRTRVGINGFDTESNKYTNPYIIENPQGEILFRQEEQYALHEQFEELLDTKKGRGYYDDSLGKVINEPFDMSEKNFINLADLEQALRRIFFPESYGPTQGFDISDKQRQFLFKAMGKYPSEFPYIRRDTIFYPDNYVKFLMAGKNELMENPQVRIFNKVGLAYGYLTDCAYITNPSAGIEFFLSVTLLVNQNETFNDGQYEYDEIGFPFLSALGKEVYHYEKKRVREYNPDLSHLAALFE